ncbi:subunit RPN7 of 26S proteasome [Chloropicon primus]|nr:subunit RPN7 of 26S proteasome [Chloropicon primus]
MDKMMEVEVEATNGSSYPHGLLESADVETIVAQYTGHALLQRLVFVAKKAAEKKDETLELEALKVACDESKKGEHTSLHKEVTELMRGRCGPEYDCDAAWVDQVDRRTAQKQDKLESELNGYKANLIKESIRMGHTFLGEFFYEKGDLNAALKCYIRTRDYCTTSKHVVTMCLNVIKVSLELENYLHVLNYVQKGEQNPGVQQDAKTMDKLKCAAGLANLANGKYKIAARNFLEVSAELDNNYSDVIAPQDVATYGAFCALASFDRSELKQKLIDSVSFRNLLELVPEVREVVYDFYASRYASCLKMLTGLKKYLEYDIYLHKHIEELGNQIREKAIVQYTIPFTSVVLQNMATAFNVDVDSLEKEIADLIANGQIHAKVDSHNKILYSRGTDQRDTTFERVKKTGSDYQRDSEHVLLRARLLEYQLVQTSGSSKAAAAMSLELDEK